MARGLLILSAIDPKRQRLFNDLTQIDHLLRVIDLPELESLIKEQQDSFTEVPENLRNTFKSQVISNQIIMASSVMLSQNLKQLRP